MTKRGRAPCPNRCDPEGLVYGGVCVSCDGRGWIYTCVGCSVRIPRQHAEFFGIHDSDGPRCARCHHTSRPHGVRPDVSIPAWVADEIVCLLGLADGLADLSRRTSKEIGCQCDQEVDGELVGLCIYHHAMDVERRARDVIDELEKAGVPRRGA